MENQAPTQPPEPHPPQPAQTRPPTERTSTLELAALPSAIPLARQHTKTVLAMWSLPPGMIETAELLVSELTTNALPPRRLENPTPTWGEMDGLTVFELRMSSRSGQLLVEVQDSNPRPPKPRVADDDAECGRGLMLVRALSDDWGYYFSGSHKIVWCVLGCAPAAVPESAAEVTCELPAVVIHPTIIPDAHQSIALRFSPNV